MLTFSEILRRSILLNVVLLAIDAVAAYFFALFKYSFVESFGDMILVEVAILFVLAGLMDFGSSIGMAQFRKVFSSSKESYSASKRKDSERRAFVFLFAGLILFSILIAAAIYEVG